MLILCNIIAFLLNLKQLLLLLLLARVGVGVVAVVVVGVRVGVGVGIGVGVLVAGQGKKGRGRERQKQREREGGREGNRWLRLAGFWRVSDWFLTLQRDLCQLDFKAKAEIPRCTNGSGGAVACGGSTKSSSKSSNESKDPCVNAFDFKFGSKISLCGPETVRKTHSSTSSSSSSSSGSGNWNRSRRRSSGKRVRE